MGKTNKKIEEKRYIFTANIRHSIYSLFNWTLLINFVQVLK